jgi:hypothetical protein
VRFFAVVFTRSEDYGGGIALADHMTLLLHFLACAILLECVLQVSGFLEEVD